MNVNVIVQQLNILFIDSVEDVNNLDSMVRDNIISSLKQIALEAQTNSEFRKELGLNQQFWIITNNMQTWVLKNLFNDEYFIFPVTLWLLRVFKNIVAAITENQNKALEQEWNKFIEQILWHFFLKYRQENDNTEFNISILRSGTQALSNMITGNTFTQECVWVDFMNRNESNDLLSTLARYGDNGTLTSCLVLVHNCIFESDTRRALVCSGSGNRLLKFLLDKTETLLEDENFELIYTIVSRLIDFDLFPTLYDSLNTYSKQIPTHNQIILLKLLDSKLHSTINISNSFSFHSCTFLLKLFNSLCPQVINLMKQLEIENSTSETNVSLEDDVPQEIEENRLLFSGLVLLLQCFVSLSQDGNNKICECLFKEGIVSTVIFLLIQADKTLPRVTKAISSSITQNLQNGITGFSHIKREIIKIIGNMSYENKIVQEEVRKMGGIPLILNQCNIDDNNPCNYAILALRNLLIDNLDNQKLIKELETIGTVQNDILKQAGIKTELDKDDTCSKNWFYNTVSVEPDKAMVTRTIKDHS
ncbi:6698_t:CDS:10 [Diversispora eburnea]|uniref:Ataxin-10 homolog n=1 Tax=Diversispora eburnea TaxID=1213867 RepID=A0A9N9C6S3_9GLOM|nr:6698_t:CDS:10 [Diversispora eburnea]